MKKFIIIFLIMVMNNIIFAEISLFTTKDEVVQGTPFEIQIEFKNSNRSNYKISGIEKFRIVSRTSRSSTIIENKSIKTIKFDTFGLIPTDVGTHSLMIEQDAEISNLITVNVLEKEKSDFEKLKEEAEKLLIETEKIISGSIAILEEEQEKEVERERVTENSRTSENYIQKDFDLNYSLEKNEIYFGEKIVYEEKFVRFKPLNNFQYTDKTYMGKLSYDDYTPSDEDGYLIRKSIVNHRGEEGEEVLLARRVLKGNASEEVTISTSSLKIKTGKTIIIPAQEEVITIKPLPQEGRPENFNIIVGELNVNEEWLKTDIELGKAAILKVKLSGYVNLDGIDKIDISDTKDYRILGTLEKKKEEVRDGRYYSEKDFEIAFIPRKPGNMETEEIIIHYFNPNTSTYESKRITPKILRVKDSSGVALEEPKEPVEDTEILKDENKNNSTPKVEEIKKNLEELRDYKKKEIIKSRTDKVYKGLIILVVTCIIGFFIKKYTDFIGKKESSLKELRKWRSYREFYEIYVKYMVKTYNFNPKIHSETRLPSETLKEINREIEKWKYEGVKFNKKKIVTQLESVESKNNKK